MKRETLADFGDQIDSKQRNFRRVLSAFYSGNLNSILVFQSIIFTLIFFCIANGQDNIKYTQGQVNESAVFSLNVPLFTYKGRVIDLPVSLSYSSSIWRIDHRDNIRRYTQGISVPQTVTQAIYSENATAGWKSSLDIPKIEWPKSTETYDYLGKPSPGSGDGCSGYRIAKVFIHMPNGGTHELRKNDVPHHLGSVDMTGTFYAVDGSRMRFDASGTDPNNGTVYLPDGTQYKLETSYVYVIDKNGNTLIYNKSNGQWSDTLGRTFVNPIPANPAAQDYTYTLPGLSGVSPNGVQTYTFKWRTLGNVLTPDENNNTPALRYIAAEYLPYPSSPADGYPNNSNYPATQPTGYDHLFESKTTYDVNEDPSLVPTLLVGKDQSQGQLFNPVVLSEIVLPDGTKYKFTYNVYGEIDKVTYPTGAYEKYVFESPVDTQNLYSGQPYAQAQRRVKSKKLSVDGSGSEILEWKYLESEWGGYLLDEGGVYKITSIIAPDKTRTEIYKYSPHSNSVKLGFNDNRTGAIIQKKMYSTSDDGLQGSLLKREITQYEITTNTVQIVAQCGQGTYTNNFISSRNARPNKQVNLIFDGSGSALAQTTTFSFNANYAMSNGVDQTVENIYGYSVISNSVAQNDPIGNISTGSLVKTVETTYKDDSNYRDLNILGLPVTVTTKNGATTVVAQSELTYDESNYSPGTVRGLPTTLKTWDSLKGVSTNSAAYLTTRAKFDTYGNVIEKTDPKGYVTATEYDSTYHAFPVNVTTPVPDSSGTYGLNTAFTTSTSYDATTGLVLSTTDINSQATTMEYNDPLLRLTKIIPPTGAAQIITEYGAGTNAATRYVKMKKQIDASTWKEAYNYYDGLGRSIKNQTIDPGGDIIIESVFDNMGRVKKTSSPYRTGETALWTENTYDDLGRIIKIKVPDNTEANTAYSLATTGSQIGKVILVTDQAAKQHRSIVNSLGQLIRVDEPNNSGDLGAINSPNQPTIHQYDLFNNLTSISQGDQTRSFSYTSLSQLTQSIHPENGTTTYTYDDNGNLVSKTDARNITTTLGYDRLNRIVTKTYSDSTTPAVSYYYDGKGLSQSPGYAKGKLTKVSNSFSETKYTAFDQAGRVTAHQQSTAGQNF